MVSKTIGGAKDLDRKLGKVGLLSKVIRQKLGKVGFLRKAIGGV